MEMKVLNQQKHLSAKINGVIVVCSKNDFVLSLYVNGELMDTTNISGKLNLNTNIPLAVGALHRGSYGSTVEYFQGTLDELKIYRKELSIAEINTLYNDFLVLNNNLLRYYNLDGNTEDLSGNNTDATIIDSTFAHRNGIANSCYVSDKSNEINVPAIGNWGNHLAISFWFYGNTNNSYQTLFGSRQNGSGATLTNLGCILQPDSTIRFFIASYDSGAPNTYTSDKIKPNDWNHVICIQNREINKNIIILNGKADSVTYTQTPRYKNYPIGFGCWNSGFNSTGGLIGRIDEIRIYNRELVIEEIDYLVNQSFDINFDNEILAEYDFMGNADDITGNGYNGNVQGAVLANDRFEIASNAYYFNSSEMDYIDLGNDLKPAEFPIFVSTWINQDDISGEQVIFRNDDWDTTSVLSGVILKTIDGKISAAYGDSTGNTINACYEKTTIDTVIEADTWYHVVVGFLDPESMVIYVDNQEVSGTYSGTITNIQYKSGNAVFGIGSNETSKFSGKIDDVRIYNRYFDPLEIDSLFNFAFNLVYNETDAAEICEGSSYTFGTQTLTEEGEYVEIFETALGCDSLVTLTLTVNPVYNITETVEICNGDVYTWEGNDYSTAGTHTITLTTVNGCDSIRKLTLTVFTVDTSVTVNQSTLTANATGKYQWVDCSNNQAISGETNQSFTPAQTGDYSVEITQNSCVDTSSCYNIVITSIAENDFGANITVYPNPASGFITVEIPELSESYRVTLIDMLGRVLLEDNLTGTSKRIDLAAYANGVYFLTVEQTQGIASQHLKSFKIIKK